MMPGVAIGQPLTAGALQIQIPANRAREFNLSSANSDQSFAFPSPTTGDRPYSAAGFASIISPQLSMPNHNDFIVRTWSTSDNTSPEDSSEMSSPEITGQNILCFPPCHSLHTLNATILPFVSSVIPNVPQELDAESLTDEELWEGYQQCWLQLDHTQTTPRPLRNTAPLRLKWNRICQVPRSMLRRKLAGKWDHNDEDMKIEFGEKDPKPVQSIKSAPSILC